MGSTDSSNGHQPCHCEAYNRELKRIKKKKKTSLSVGRAMLLDRVYLGSRRGRAAKITSCYMAVQDSTWARCTSWSRRGDRGEEGK